jgi:hypothetical protein
MKLLRRSLLGLLLAGGLAAWVVLRHLEPSSPVGGPNYSLIEDGLYMGGRVREPPPGTEAVLNLCRLPDRYRTEVHLEKGIRDAAPAPDLDWLREAVAWVDAQRRAGRTTFVHCRAGVSRSGMVVVAYLMFKYRWGREQALAFVRQRRDVVRPNLAFLELLDEWERTLRRPAGLRILAGRC